MGPGDAADVPEVDPRAVVLQTDEAGALLKAGDFDWAKIFAGGVNDYRSAISLGEGFDGIVMETTSARAEPDYATANVQAVDVARRANRMIAVQSLDVSSSFWRAAGSDASNSAARRCRRARFAV